MKNIAKFIVLAFALASLAWFANIGKTKEVLASLGFFIFDTQAAQIPITEGAPGTKTLDNEISVASWNVYNFDSDDIGRVEFMAGILRHFDLVALQEINVVKGAKGVALLAEALSRKGAKWDYVVSDKTNSSNAQSAERYAYIWRTDKVTRTGKAALSAVLDEGIEREPYIAVFEVENGKEVTLVNCHLVPTSKNPSHEAAQIPKIIRKEPSRNWLILGDFNQDHTTEGMKRILKEGYQCSLPNQATSLKTNAVPDKEKTHLNEPYDNIYFNQKQMEIVERGTVDFAKAFKTNKEAKEISDHIPVWAKFKIIN